MQNTWLRHQDTVHPVLILYLAASYVVVLESIALLLGISFSGDDDNPSHICTSYWYKVQQKYNRVIDPLAQCMNGKSIHAIWLLSTVHHHGWSDLAWSHTRIQSMSRADTYILLTNSSLIFLTSGKSSKLMTLLSSEVFHLLSLVRWLHQVVWHSTWCCFGHIERLPSSADYRQTYWVASHHSSRTSSYIDLEYCEILAPPQFLEGQTFLLSTASSD